MSELNDWYMQAQDNVDNHRLHAALKALDQRISGLETDITDARDHYGDAFGEVDVRLRAMRHRLDEAITSEKTARHHQVAQIDKALSAHRFEDEHKGIEERLAALEARAQCKDVEVKVLINKSDCNLLEHRRVEQRLKKIEYAISVLEDGSEPVEPVHDEKPCETCRNGLSLDEYEDILCLRASTWDHPCFEKPTSVGCDYHEQRED